MKAALYLATGILLLNIIRSIGQNTFVYDQQSTNIVEGGSSLQSGQPMGQSFTPALTSIDFIEFLLYDSDALNHAGATVYVNLRSNAITGPVLGTSAAVFLSDGYFGVTSFSFSNSISILPGVTYFLQPQILSGDTIGSDVTDDSYNGGTAFAFGMPNLNRDLWFREGIVVPEPSSSWLAAIGAGLLIGWHRLRKPTTFS